MRVRRAWPPMRMVILERRVARREMDMEGKGQEGILLPVLSGGVRVWRDRFGGAACSRERIH